jgi:hypothetical protein
MTECRIYHGVKFHIQDHWKCGHINLVINGIETKQDELDAVSTKLSEDLGVEFQDMHNASQRVWGISRFQLAHFTQLTSEDSH